MEFTKEMYLKPFENKGYTISDLPKETKAKIRTVNMFIARNKSGKLTEKINNLIAELNSEADKMPNKELSQVVEVKEPAAVKEPVDVKEPVKEVSEEKKKKPVKNVEKKKPVEPELKAPVAPIAEPQKKPIPTTEFVKEEVEVKVEKKPEIKEKKDEFEEVEEEIENPKKTGIAGLASLLVGGVLLAFGINSLMKDK